MTDTSLSNARRAKLAARIATPPNADISLKTDDKNNPYDEDADKRHRSFHADEAKTTRKNLKTIDKYATWLTVFPEIVYILKCMDVVMSTHQFPTFYNATALGRFTIDSEPDNSDFDNDPWAKKKIPDRGTGHVIKREAHEKAFACAPHAGYSRLWPVHRQQERHCRSIQWGHVLAMQKTSVL